MGHGQRPPVDEEVNVSTQTKSVVPLRRVVIRFAGDSGDGMQLTGDRFTSETAGLGNDLSTLPDFPAEIRAPAGTVNGVSAFQVNIADHKITIADRKSFVEASIDAMCSENPAVGSSPDDRSPPQ